MPVTLEFLDALLVWALYILTHLIPVSPYSLTLPFLFEKPLTSLVHNFLVVPCLHSS